MLIVGFDRVDARRDSIRHRCADNGSPRSIIGNGTSELHHVILPGFEERLYLLEWNGGNVAIAVGSEGQDLEEWLEQVSPIIESMKFAT